MDQQPPEKRHTERHSDWDVQDWDEGFETTPNAGAAGWRALAGIAVSITVMGAGVLYLANLSPSSVQQAPQKLSYASETSDRSVAAMEEKSVKTSPEISKTLPSHSSSPDPKEEAIKSVQKVTSGPADSWAPSLKPSLSVQASNNTTDLESSASPKGFWPSLKPNSDSAPLSADAPNAAKHAAERSTPKIVRTKTATSLGASSLTPNHIRPSPVFFQSDITPDRTPPPPLAVALASDLYAPTSEITITMKRGETFVDVLKRAGITATDRNNAAAAFGEHQSLRRLRPGQTFVITRAAPNQTLFQHVSPGAPDDMHLLDLRFRSDAESRIELARAEDGGITARKYAIPITTRLAAVSGRIEGSLFLSAKRAGAPDKVVANLANMFVYDIDFQRDIFGGDEFEAVFELHYDDEGALIGSGDVLYGRMKWRGRNKEKGYYRFAQSDGRADYFDRAGQSARRLLMKTPIDGARLSSGFGTRKHPILGYRKAHKGVDFAARRGTPIYAAGDGVIKRANRFGSFGNYIRIRHSNGYETAYAHLKGFRKGVRAGKRVRQGDVIGYVGTTGRSTGPHLHYEVHHKGRAVNPQKLKIATGVALKGGALDAFKAVRDDIDALRHPAVEPSNALASDDQGADAANAL